VRPRLQLSASGRPSTHPLGNSSIIETVVQVTIPPQWADFDVGARFVAGIEAIRCLIFPSYRSRLRDYWRLHPSYRPHHIRMMICGVLFYVVSLAFLAFIVIVLTLG
jgi:hypothetical protein